MIADYQGGIRLHAIFCVEDLKKIWLSFLRVLFSSYCILIHNLSIANFSPYGADPIRSRQELSSIAGNCRALPGIVEHYRELSSIAGNCRALPAIIEHCRELSSITGNCRVLPVIIGHYR